MIQRQYSIGPRKITKAYTNHLFVKITYLNAVVMPDEEPEEEEEEDEDEDEEEDDE